jgi:hypothetical protein
MACVLVTLNVDDDDDILCMHCVCIHMYVYIYICIYIHTPSAISTSGRAPGSEPGGPVFNTRLVPRVISLVGRQEGHPVRKIISQLQ